MHFGRIGSNLTEKFGESMMNIYGDIIRQYVSEGFLTYHEEKGRLAFTESGMDVSNWFLSDFLHVIRTFVQELKTGIKRTIDTDETSSILEKTKKSKIIIFHLTKGGYGDIFVYRRC